MVDILLACDFSNISLILNETLSEIYGCYFYKSVSFQPRKVKNKWSNAEHCIVSSGDLVYSINVSKYITVFSEKALRNDCIIFIAIYSRLLKKSTSNSSFTFSSTKNYLKCMQKHLNTSLHQINTLFSYCRLFISSIYAILPIFYLQTSCTYLLSSSKCTTIAIIT